MVKIRLKRMGKKRAPFYRVVVADVRAPRDGKFIEAIGFYDPTRNPAKIEINKERVEYWVNNGAQLTDTVKVLFKK
ncbi:MAG: 30S ribosomal protein S16 [Oscillospiraceae bacterium]|nr:30S ribosomal protein S16 [Oscillospiraceae bacterium]